MAKTAPIPTPAPPEPPSGERLDSWKEIAAYLKREIRTVQRWEKLEGLPVHRHLHEKQGTVYAYRAELDTWWKNGHPRLEQEEQTQATTRRRRIPWLLATTAMLMVFAGLAVWRHWAKLRLSPSAGSAEPSAMVIRRLWEAEPSAVGLLGTPSRDGRLLCYTDWVTGDLAVHDLVTGKDRRVTNKGPWTDSSEWAEFPTLSADGEQIAYSWWNQYGFYDLRVIRLDGSEPRILYSRKGTYIHPYQWSPDGKEIIAFFNNEDGIKHLALFSATVGSVSVLKTWAGSTYVPVSMSFSPDGRYVAYDLQSKEEPSNRDIFLLATDGTRDVPLVEHPGNDFMLGWSPAGSGIVFASDRGGTLGIWFITVADGRRQGAAKLLKADVGALFPLGITEDGLFYYRLETGISDVYTTRLRGATGELRDEPERVSKRYEGANSAPDWSPDGRQLLYVSHRGPGHLGFRSAVLVIRSVAGGNEYELSPKLRNLLWPFPSAPLWSPNGRYILAAGNDLEGNKGLYLIDATTGELRPLLQNRMQTVSEHPAWLPDGKAIIYIFGTWGRADRIVHRELETGEEKELYRESEEWRGKIAPSPDGQSLAFYRGRNALMVMSSAGGPPREVLRLQKEEMCAGPYPFVEWTPDGRSLLFPKKDSELWRVPADGGEAQKLGLNLEGLRDLRVHPDGQRVAFVAGKAGVELWVLGDFLPPEGTTR